MAIPEDVWWGAAYGTTRADRGWRIARMESAIDPVVHAGTRAYRSRSQRPYVGPVALGAETRGGGPYYVKLGGTPSCSCPDWRSRHERVGHCKHIHAAVHWLSRPRARDSWFPANQIVESVATGERGTVVYLRDYRVWVQWPGGAPPSLERTDALDRIAPGGDGVLPNRTPSSRGVGAVAARHMSYAP